MTARDMLYTPSCAVARVRKTSGTRDGATSWRMCSAVTAVLVSDFAEGARDIRLDDR